MGHCVSICTANNANEPISGCPQIIVHTQSNVEQDNYSKKCDEFCIICTNRISLYNRKSTETCLLFHTISFSCTNHQAQVLKRNYGSTISSFFDCFRTPQHKNALIQWWMSSPSVSAAATLSNQTKAHKAGKVCFSWNKR